jgi:hypothetical protein
MYAFSSNNEFKSNVVQTRNELPIVSDTSVMKGLAAFHRMTVRVVAVYSVPITWFRTLHDLELGCCLGTKARDRDPC